MVKSVVGVSEELGVNGLLKYSSDKFPSCPCYLYPEAKGRWPFAKDTH